MEHHKNSVKQKADVSIISSLPTPHIHQQRSDNIHTATEAEMHQP